MALRALLAVALLLPFLFGLLEAGVFFQLLFRRGAGGPVGVAIGILTVATLPLSGWGLARVRTMHPWKLTALLVASSFLATVGFFYFVAFAH